MRQLRLRATWGPRGFGDIHYRYGLGFGAEGVDSQLLCDSALNQSAPGFIGGTLCPSGNDCSDRGIGNPAPDRGGKTTGK
jgi:hypothetical protein